MNSMRILDAEGWIGIYINDRLEYSSHKLGIKNFINYCRINNVDINNVSVYELNIDGIKWLNETAKLPHDFYDISIDYLEKRL